MLLDIIGLPPPELNIATSPRTMKRSAVTTTHVAKITAVTTMTPMKTKMIVNVSLTVASSCNEMRAHRNTAENAEPIGRIRVRSALRAPQNPFHQLQAAVHAELVVAADHPRALWALLLL